MTELAAFHFADQEFRALSIDGEPWLVAADVASILGYSAPSAMTRSLDDDEKGVQSLHTPGGLQNLAIISESGLYAAVLRSTMPAAREFKRWVTHEVLPAIRKTGLYVVAETPEQIMARGLVAAQQMLETAQTQVAELKPRAEAWDQLAAATGDYEVGDAAKILARAGIETGRGRLFSSLADLGWIYRSPNGSWKARQTCVDAGYLAEKPQSHYHPGNGDLVIDPPQVRVTIKGIEKLRQRLSKPLDLTA